MNDRELFRVTLRPAPGTAGLQALRLALKTLRRRYGLQCVRVEIVLPEDASVLEQTPHDLIADADTHS
jgi:hypothetical protein